MPRFVVYSDLANNKARAFDTSDAAYSYYEQVGGYGNVNTMLMDLDDQAWSDSDRTAAWRDAGVN